MGLQEAVGAALEYIIAAIEGGPEPDPVPEQLLGQARAAARNGVPLDTVLRRYFAGYTLLGDFLIREAQKVGAYPGAELRRALRSQAASFDHLVASISETYAREAENRLRSSGRRRAERVKMLLAGEPVDPDELRYELNAWHLAAIACGPGAVEMLRELVGVLDRNLLLVRPDEGSVWAWFGGRSRLSVREVLHLAEQGQPEEVSLALGEPGQGVEGWRLSHRQAKAAMTVLQRAPQRRACYADVALLASALRDEVLAGSLREIYLAPLGGERDGGAALRQTLTAYFGAGRNASSAAAALGVSRKTVSIRLRSAEERIGRPLDGCGAELETALSLQELGHHTDSEA